MAEKTYIVLLKDGRTCKVKADSIFWVEGAFGFHVADTIVAVFSLTEAAGAYQESIGELLPVTPKKRGSQVLTASESGQ